MSSAPAPQPHDAPPAEPLLAQRVAIVTGAGSGIGAAAARLLAQHGARVAAVDIDEQDLRQTVDSVQGHAGGEARAFIADVADERQMAEVVQSVQEQWGRGDIVFANAGINGVWAPLDDLEPEEWDRTLRINLRGTFITVRTALPLLKRNGGSIIITSSVNGTRMFSNSGASAYATSKAGQVAFAKMTALELAKDRIRVNAICPGGIETQIGESTHKRNIDEAREPVRFPEGEVPLTDGKPGTAEQVARLVLFLASDQSDHISGAEIFIDGAQSLLQG